MDKVHCPNLVGGRCVRSSFAQLRLDAPLRRLAPQLQARLTIETPDPLRVHAPAFTTQQHVDSPIAVAHPRLGDLFDPLVQDGLRTALTLVVVTGSLGLKNRAGPPDTHPPKSPLSDQPLRAAAQTS